METVQSEDERKKKKQWGQVKGGNRNKMDILYMQI